MVLSEKDLSKVRLLLVIFTAGLVLSGLTAFPLRWELGILAGILGIAPDGVPESYEGLRHWICFVRNGLQETYEKYPFLAYGTDWLAFAHLLLALLFIGPYRDPVRNVWVLRFGLWACLLVVPLALICGPLRGIPFYWRLVDCSFGVFGFLVLYPAWRLVRRVA